MIGLAMFHTIITLWQQKNSQRSIARSTGVSRDTVRWAIDKYNKYGFDNPPKTRRENQIDKYKDQIIKYLEHDLSAVRIHEELSSLGAKMGYSTVKIYIAKIKGKNNICVRFHTKAGEEAQVDFGYVGLQPNPEGKMKKAWVFNMRLSYSRLDYYEIVFDQTVKTFIQAHINAFRYYNGLPKVIKIDNLKAAILEAHFYEDTYQEMYRKFSEHYGFSILACRVRKPQEKGKTEAGIKFVKNNFFAGRKFSTHQEMVNGLKAWLNKQNQRIHGTTKKIPGELFKEEEKSQLISLPLTDFIIPQITRRKVGRDCHITLDNNYYSVPYEHVGKTVDIELDNKLVRISYENQQVALHTRSTSTGVFITNETHYQEGKYYTPDSSTYRIKYNDKMKLIGQYAEKIFSLLLIQQPYHWYKTVKGILNLKKIYSSEVIELSCKRALYFEVTSYSKIKNICRSGSYQLPLDNNKPEDHNEVI